MDRDSLTLEKLSEVANDIIYEDVCNLMNLTLGDDRSKLALDLEEHPTQGLDGEIRSVFELEDHLHRCFDFAVEAKEGSDDLSDEEALDALISMNFGRISFADSTLQKHQKILSDLFSLHNARYLLEYGEPGETLSRTQIAGLGNLAVETVRLAGFADGPDLLPQERPGIARVTDVRRWLIHKNRYKEFKRLPPMILNPGVPAESENEVADLVRHQAIRLLERTGDVDLIVAANARPAFRQFLKQRRFDANDIGWVNVDNAAALAKKLQIDPKWLFENLDRWAMEARRQALLAEMDDHSEPAPLERAPEGAVVNRELIRAVLASQPSIGLHPSQRKPNVKLDGYQVKDGPAFAHQHDGKAQYFWVPENLELPDGVTAQHYPAVAANEPAARHSGLIKFPELGRTAIKKIRIKDRDALNDIVDALVGLKDLA